MKKAIFYLIFILLNSLSCFSQDIINNPGSLENEVIQQINAPGINDIMSFQTLNQGIGNYANTRQVGNQNRLMVNQKADAVGSSNQSYNHQEGNYNEMTVGQIGNGNVLLGFQLGYVTYELGRNQGNNYGFGLGNGNGNAFAYGHDLDKTETIVVGERNKLVISQEGSHNGVLSVQQGSDNSVSVEQKGNNNYLLLMQQGNRNSVSGYVQETQDERPNYDVIIQLGNELSLNATDLSKSKQNGNSFRQEGENLSLQINNQFANSLGGIEIDQTGRDMKLVVDQSFFIK